MRRFDSDTVLLTDNEILINVAKKNYTNFLVSTNNVESLKRKREYSSEQKCDLDIKTKGNIIGEDINLSQDLNSILWDKLNNGATVQQVQSIYSDICTLNVISNLAIDSAKKEFIVDINKEMKKIQKKYKRKDESNRTIKPHFFEHIARKKGYCDKSKTNYKSCKTTMDYVVKSINRYRRSRKLSNKEEIKNFYEIIDTDEFDSTNVYYEQIGRVLNLIDDTVKTKNSIYSNPSYTNEEKYKLYSECQQNCTEYIGKLKFTKDTMISILKKVDDYEDKKNGRKAGNMLFNILFGYPNTSFFEIIKESSTPIAMLKRDDCGGNIPIFHMNFAKTYKNEQKTSDFQKSET